jgi:ribosome-associated translation inhibitor RaiA
MQTPLKITFHGMPSSMWVESFIETRVARLERTCGRLQKCSVVVDKPHHHHRHGNTFHIHLDIAVPGKQFAFSRDRERDHGHEDVYVAITDAFRAARRQLQDHAHASHHGAAGPE